MDITEKNSRLKIKSFRAMLWSGFEVLLRQGVQFIVAVILARLISPEEFGTIALLYLFTGIASVFIDGGFSSSLIQRQETTLADESTVFWTNLAMGVVVALILWSSAPLIAVFFGFPILVPLTGMLALSLVINAIGSIHQVLFIKHLDFKSPLMVGALSSMVSGTLAIYLAFNDFGVWALAWQTVAASLVSTLMLWLISPWRPAMVFSADSLRRLFRFGSYLMLSGLLDIAYNRIYSVLIGKFYGVRDLAFYNRADNTKQIPVEVLSRTISRVVFPVFSAVASDKSKLQRGVQLAVKGIMLINLPMMFGLMATAENAVVTLFGANWQPSAPILQILCLAGIFWPLHIINLNVLTSLGHSNLFFRLEVIKKIVGTIFILVGSLFGIIGIAWSQVAFGLVGFVINAYYSGKYLEYGAYRQIKDVMPIVLVSMLMALFVSESGKRILFDREFVLLAQVALGVVAFVALTWMLRIRVFDEVYSQLKSMR